MLKEKMEQKETEQKQKMKFFVWFFVFFKRREKRLKTIISKILERPNGFFPHKCF